MTADAKTLREICVAVLDAREDGFALLDGRRAHARDEFLRVVSADVVLALLDALDAAKDEIRQLRDRVKPCGRFMDAEDYRDHLPCVVCEPRRGGNG